MLRAQGQLHESGSTGRAVRGGGVSFSSALSQASAGKRRAQLGMYYDDVCRRAAAELRCARARARAVARRSGPSAPARRTPISCCSARSCASISGCLAWPRRPTTATSARRGRLSTRARARGGCRVFLCTAGAELWPGWQGREGRQSPGPFVASDRAGQRPPPILFCRAARSQVAAGKAAAGKSQWQSGHGYANGGKSAQWSGKRWNSWGSAGEYRGYNWGAAERGGEDNRRPRTPPRPVKKARP